MPEKKAYKRIERKSDVQVGRDYARGMAGLSLAPVKAKYDAAEKISAKNWDTAPKDPFSNALVFNKSMNRQENTARKAENLYNDVRRISQGKSPRSDVVAGNTTTLYGENKSGINRPSASVQKMLKPGLKNATSNALALAKARKLGGK